MTDCTKAKIGKYILSPEELEIFVPESAPITYISANKFYVSKDLPELKLKKGDIFEIKKEAEDNFKRLGKNESDILDEILKSENGLTVNSLVKKTGIDRLLVYRSLDTLRVKGLVEDEKKSFINRKDSRKLYKAVKGLI